MQPASFLSLLRLVSPALPVGAYAYSQGLEWAVAEGQVADADQLRAWIAGVLTHGLASLELPLVARTYAAWDAGDARKALALGQELLAWRDSAEARQEERQMGAALARILAASNVAHAAPCLQPPATADTTYLGMFALACSAWGVPLRESLLAYAWAFMENQVTAGVKLIPLGQTAGQAVLASLLQPAQDAVEAALSLPTDASLCSSLPGRSLAQLRHETQHVRLFRS